MTTEDLMLRYACIEEPDFIEESFLNLLKYTVANDLTAQADGEIKELLESCYNDAKRILTEKRELLDEIALYLLEKETIVGDELMAFIRADEKKSEPETETPEEQAAEQEPTE